MKVVMILESLKPIIPCDLSDDNEQRGENDKRDDGAVVFVFIFVGVHTYASLMVTAVVPR